MDQQPQGKTLWEKFRESIDGGKNGGAGPFCNPLDLQVGSPVPVADTRPDFGGVDFSVKTIREWTRTINGEEFKFADYILQGSNVAGQDKPVEIKLRSVPTESGGHMVILLQLFDRLGWDDGQGLLNAAKGSDDTHEFDTFDDNNQRTRYSRINSVLGSYKATVRTISNPTPDGKTPPAATQTGAVEYWDFWRDASIGGTDHTHKEFVFVELDNDSGMLEVWQGTEYFG